MTDNFGQKATQTAKQAAISAAKQVVYQSGEAAKTAGRQITGTETAPLDRMPPQIDRSDAQRDLLMQEEKAKSEAADRERALKLKEALEELLQAERQKKFQRDKEWQESQARAMQTIQQKPYDEIPLSVNRKRGPGLFGGAKHAIQTKISNLSGRAEKKMGNLG